MAALSTRVHRHSGSGGVLETPGIGSFQHEVQPHHLRVQVGGIKMERHHRDRLNHEGRKTRAYHPPFLRPQDGEVSARGSLETGRTHFGGSHQSPSSADEFKDSPCAAWCVRLVRRYNGGEVEGVPYCGANDKKAAKSTVQKVCTSSMGRLSHVLGV